MLQEHASDYKLQSCRALDSFPYSVGFWTTPRNVMANVIGLKTGHFLLFEINLHAELGDKSKL